MENHTPTPHIPDPSRPADGRHGSTHDRPFGFWLRAVDHLIARESASVFADEGVSPREARLLAVVAGIVPGAHAPDEDERLRRRFASKLRRLADRGWATESDGSWSLTDEGRAVQERLTAALDGVRARVAGSVSEADFATTRAPLEAIARDLGEDRIDAGRPGFGRPGFGPRGFGRHGFGGPRGLDDRSGDHDRGHGHGRRRAKQAYARGFDAGFARGREATA